MPVMLLRHALKSLPPPLRRPGLSEGSDSRAFYAIFVRGAPLYAARSSFASASLQAGSDVERSLTS